MSSEDEITVEQFKKKAEEWYDKVHKQGKKSLSWGIEQPTVKQKKDSTSKIKK